MERRGSGKTDRKKARAEAVGYLGGGGRKMAELFKVGDCYVQLEVVLCGMLARGMYDRFVLFLFLLKVFFFF